MTLSPGTQLGSFEVSALIGVGGMGEVYRARDTKLGRDVAIKVLPEVFAKDKDRLARFEREAKTLASLDHPGIGAIYDLQEADGIRFLVMQLVEGQTLADRIAAGAVPVDEALPLFAQIAEALENAHEHGIIHRDLKPANIKVTQEGKVKVLDFGLAKAFEGPASSTSGPGGTVALEPDSAASLTNEGVILGTAPYMSPEQARGGAIDKRADIWAFGAVLFEALTGRRAFRGETVSDTLAKILQGQPEWDLLPDSTPWKVRELLRRCLEKDPLGRLRDIGDARIELKQLITDSGQLTSAAGLIEAPRPSRRGPLIAWSVASLVLGGLIAGLAVWSAMRPAPPPVRRFELGLPLGESASAMRHPVISADGKLLAYVHGPRGPSQHIHLRPLDLFDVDVSPIAGTEGGNDPFFSPGGDWLGFRFGPSQSTVLKKVRVVGGSSVTITEQRTRRAGATWGRDDMIVFGSLEEGLWRVFASGGEAVQLTAPDTERGEGGHALPWILPGGRGLFFTFIRLESLTTGIALLRLETMEWRTLIDEGLDARYTPTGHIVYANDAALWAAPFDLDRLELAGSPVPVVSGVNIPQRSPADYDISDGGTLVYAPDRDEEGQPGTLVWVDRDGSEEPALPGLAKTLIFPQHPRLSPDGRRIAVTTGPGADADLWVYDLRGRPPLLLTREGVETSSAWSPDGQRLAFESDRAGPWGMYSIRADGSELEPALIIEQHQHPMAWTPDGNELISAALDQDEMQTDIWALPMQTPGKAENEHRVIVATRYQEGGQGVSLSPDGHWLAYSTDRSGQDEIWVQPYPGREGVAPVQISLGGGTEPVWARDGSEIYYLQGDKMMAVAVETDPEFDFEPPVLLFEGKYSHASQAPNYDVGEDGRFLMIKLDESHDERFGLRVVVNWFEELERLVPTGKK